MSASPSDLPPHPARPRPPGPFRCAGASAALGEPLAGTASTVSAFLLLETPGAWGVDALRDSRLPDTLATEITRRCRRHGVRPLLIRRHGRSGTRRPRCFAAYADPEHPWLESSTLSRPEDLLDLDLASLGRGESAGLHPRSEPLFLVCTHGRHDACCAERGRPVAAALARSHPEETWECSHIGGDRFAGNVLVLPEGLYYGRVDAADAPALARAHRSGQLDLDHLRGRAGFGFAAQAAEWHLRHRLGLTGADDVALRRQTSGDGVTEAVFEVSDVGEAAESGHWVVRVRTVRAEPAQLTCGSAGPRRAVRQQLVDLRPAGVSPSEPSGW